MVSEDVDDVPTSEDDDWVSVVAEFAVRLLRDEGGRHQDAELTGSKSRDEARLRLDADPAVGAVTLRFECEVQLDLIA